MEAQLIELYSHLHFFVLENLESVCIFLSYQHDTRLNTSLTSRHNPTRPIREPDLNLAKVEALLLLSVSN